MGEFALQPESPAPLTADRVPYLTIERGRRARDYWWDIWAYRDLFAILAWRDIAVRYKQTTIGVAWAVIRPLITMLVFVFIFGRLAKLPSDGAVPYPILVFAGMLPWFLFATILTESSNSLINNSNLVGKVYFPRLIIPAAAAIVALVDFAVSLVLLIGMMLWYGFMPGWQILCLPLVVLLALIASLGPAIGLAALNVKYRDFRYIVPFVVQFGLYVSPVGFSSAVVPAEWQLAFAINPMVGVIDAMRWCLLGGIRPPGLPGFLVSLSVMALLLWIGIAYFRRSEARFADLI